MFWSASTTICSPFFAGEWPSAKLIEDRTDIPPSAKLACHVWIFVIEVSGNGIPDFLMNHCQSAEQLICTHRALQTIQATEMLTLLEAAIPLVREEMKQFGEWCEFPRHEWIDAFDVNPAWPVLDAISKPSWTVAAGPL